MSIGINTPRVIKMVLVTLSFLFDVLEDLILHRLSFIPFELNEHDPCLIVIIAVLSQAPDRCNPHVGNTISACLPIVANNSKSYKETRYIPSVKQYLSVDSSLTNRVPAATVCVDSLLPR